MQIYSYRFLLKFSQRESYCRRLKMKISTVIFFQSATLNTRKAYPVKKRKKNIPSSLVNKASRKSVPAFELDVLYGLKFRKICITIAASCCERNYLKNDGDYALLKLSQPFYK